MSSLDPRAILDSMLSTGYIAPGFIALCDKLRPVRNAFNALEMMRDVSDAETRTAATAGAMAAAHVNSMPALVTEPARYAYLFICGRDLQAKKDDVYVAYMKAVDAWHGTYGPWTPSTAPHLTAQWGSACWDLACAGFGMARNVLDGMDLMCNNTPDMKARALSKSVQALAQASIDFTTKGGLEKFYAKHKDALVALITKVGKHTPEAIFTEGKFAHLLLSIPFVQARMEATTQKKLHRKDLVRVYSSSCLHFGQLLLPSGREIKIDPYHEGNAKAIVKGMRFLFLHGVMPANMEPDNFVVSPGEKGEPTLKVKAGGVVPLDVKVMHQTIRLLAQEHKDIETYLLAASGIYLHPDAAFFKQVLQGTFPPLREGYSGVYLPVPIAAIISDTVSLVTVKEGEALRLRAKGIEKACIEKIKTKKEITNDNAISAAIGLVILQLYEEKGEIGSLDFLLNEDAYDEIVRRVLLMAPEKIGLTPRTPKRQSSMRGMHSPKAPASPQDPDNLDRK